MQHFFIVIPVDKKKNKEAHIKNQGQKTSCCRKTGGSHPICMETQLVLITSGADCESSMSLVWTHSYIHCGKKHYILSSLQDHLSHEYHYKTTENPMLEWQNSPQMLSQLFKHNCWRISTITTTTSQNNQLDLHSSNWQITQNTLASHSNQPKFQRNQPEPKETPSNQPLSNYSKYQSNHLEYPSNVY